MNRPDPTSPAARHPPRLTRALRLTRAGMWWESLARAFWPAVTLALLMFAALSFGALSLLPAAPRVWAVAAGLAVVGLALIWGALRFRRPGRFAAESRIDATLPGRPIAGLEDRPAIGTDGAVWQAHRAQLAHILERAKPVTPDAELSRRDPFALRLIALSALAMALLFGSVGQISQGLAALAPSRPPPAKTIADGLAWEGWAEPPAYTRKPTLYLNAQPDDATLVLPEGSVISLRLYDSGARVMQDVGDLNDADPTSPSVRVQHSGQLAIGAQNYTVRVQPDGEPQVALGPVPERRADGRLIQSFSASDDFGVTAGRAEIGLNLARIDRRFGLAADPEDRPDLSLALPLRGNRPQAEGQLVADLKKHPWANMPVQIRLQVEDGIGQNAQSRSRDFTLPGRRFFDPLASALIELRRDLLWSRKNASQSARLLRAIIWNPDGLVTDDQLSELQSVISGLEAGALDETRRDALAEVLWRVAIKLEDGGLADALERMQRAQERLSQAMRRGASADEIGKLMQELRDAAKAYTQMLAEKGEDPVTRFDRSESQSVSGDEIQKMMDDIQNLMNEGRMAEAQALLDQFSRMMENMQVRQGEGDGPTSSDKRMAETLREQQDLADEAFRQLQNEWLGQPQSPGEGADGEGEGEGEGDLAGRQRALRDDLGMQRGLMPERGSPEGQRAGDAMDRAGAAMSRAEDALREGDTAGAMDQQAEAVEALREGIRELRGDGQQGDGQQGDEAASDATDGQPGEGPQGQAPVGQGRQGSSAPRRDPLGRSMPGTGGGAATDGALAGGEGDESRARDLQDEIRRKLSEPGRPKSERDYLDRLIDRF